MLSHVEEGGFYRTCDGGVSYVLLDEDEEGDAWLIVLSGRSEEFAPGDTYFLRPDGSVLGREDNEADPMRLRERLDLQLPAGAKWQAFYKSQGAVYTASRWEWIDLMSDMQQLLELYAKHSPPVPEAGAFYLTLNGSIAYVLEVEDEDVHVALLKGGAAGLSAGDVYRLAEDGSPGGFNPLEFGLVFHEKLELGWE